MTIQDSECDIFKGGPGIVYTYVDDGGLRVGEYEVCGLLAHVQQRGMKLPVKQVQKIDEICESRQWHPRRGRLVSSNTISCMCVKSPVPLSKAM
jgi:hypothetical protein